MSDLPRLLASGEPVPHHAPWPRAVVGADAWEEAARWLAEGRLTLLGLWGEAAWAHMAVLAGGDVAVVSIACPDGRYPSVGRVHSPAIRLERAMRDLYGMEPVGLPDTRPWLVHGAAPYDFLPVTGDDLHEIAVGPVHAGIIEPGHFRFTCDGETVVRLEARLGYTHKGVEALLAGASIADGAKIAGRISGDSTVAYALAFARAAEAAAGVDVPARAGCLRGLMAEMERLANHFGDIGAICNDAGFAIMLSQFALLREAALRTNVAVFGHRLCQDIVCPGGVAADLLPAGLAAIGAFLAEVDGRFPRLVSLYDRTASLQDRTVGTGRVPREWVMQFGTGGPNGRASGREFDARASLPYAPYDRMRFAVPVLAGGDVDARVWLRIREVGESVSLIRQIIAALEPGPVRLADDDWKAGGWQAGAAGREGMALVEGFRGDVLVWLRIGADGRISRCHVRDPSWFQWPLLEAAIHGNIVADFPLCNKSFNCSYSGHDL